jgi:hypothetical protein
LEVFTILILEYSASRASLYAPIFASAAYFGTESMETYYEDAVRKVEPGLGRKLPGFLVHEHDPFAKRIAEMKKEA